MYYAVDSIHSLCRDVFLRFMRCNADTYCYQELDSQGNLIYAFLQCLKTPSVTMHILADGYSIGGWLVVMLCGEWLVGGDAMW